MSRKNPPTIEIYAMYQSPDGGSSTDPETSGVWKDTPDFYDVAVRYEGDDPIEEVEDLKTIEEAYQAARNLQTIYVGAEIDECIP